MAAPFRQGRFEELPELPRLPHVWAAAPGRRVEVDSRAFGRVGLHVRFHGTGPPLLLVHGLMTSSYSYRYCLPLLGRRFTLYVPDLPGAGRSDAPLSAAYHPDAIADLIGELQRALGIRGCAAVGNSMGGYLCLRLALRDPGAFSRLVDVHSPGLATPRIWALAAALSLPGAGGLLRRLVQRDPLRWAHRNVHYWDESLKSLEEAREYGAPLATPEGFEAFRRYLADTLAPGPMRAFRRELQARHDAGEAFPVPLLLLYAERDPMVPAAIGRELGALIPSARLQWLKEASHFAHVDAAERFAEAAIAFLKA